MIPIWHDNVVKAGEVAAGDIFGIPFGIPTF